MEVLEEKNTEESLELLGLSTNEVNEQIALGNVNISKEKAGKSYLRITCDNLFTFFNMVWAVVAIVLVAFGSYTNLTFLPVIIPNILIGLFSEIKAKQTVEKLSVTMASIPGSSWEK